MTNAEAEIYRAKRLAATRYWLARWQSVLVNKQQYDSDNWYIAGYMNYMRGSSRTSYDNGGTIFSDPLRKKRWLEGYDDAKGDWS